MNNYRYLNTPWAVSCDLYSPPGSLIVKLTLGESPDAIPTALDVRRGRQKAATALTIGSVDRMMHHFTDRVRITRVHTAAASLGRPGLGHTHFDDIEHVLGLSRTFRVEADKGTAVGSMVDALRQLGTVEQAYPNYLTSLPFLAPTFTLPTQLEEDDAWYSREMIRASAALAYEAGDPAIIVCVVDTGVMHSHPELSDKLRTGLDTVQLTMDHMASGVQLVGDESGIDTEPEDAVGHGTSCAAIIGALGDHIPPGLSGNCSLMPIRVLGAARFPGRDEPVGIGSIADIDLGVKSAIDLGAKVINMSFGTPETLLDATDPPPHEDVVRYGLARNCVMIAASGNSGKQENFSPASLDGVIAVGAVGADGTPTTFSTRGQHVAVCAPGERVYSAGLNGYQMVTGTSFAAPFVAAAAGLLVSRAARRAYPLDGHDVRRLLSESAARWKDDRYQNAGHGAGVLDAYAALRTLDAEIDRSRLPEHPVTTGRGDG